MFPPDYIQFVRERFRAWPTDPARTFIHAVIGLRTEIDEYETAESAENALEELGDALFYCVAMFPFANIPDNWDPTAFDIDSATDHEAEQGVVDLTDMAKKWLAYDRPPHVEDIRKALLSFILFIGQRHAEHLTLIIDHNRAKLLKRFPTGFTTADAIARADKEPGQ